MIKKITTAIITAAMALTAVSCGNSGSGGNSSESGGGTAESVAPAANEYSFKESTENTTPDFNNAAANFSAELFKNISAEDVKSGKNVFTSPESVMLALGLAANGAGGDTLKQFEQVLGKGMKLEDINAGLARLMTKAKNSSWVKYDIANSIWVKEGGEITLKKSYAQLCKERFDAESYLVPFNTDTVNRINSWVKDHTDGMIDKIKEGFTPDEAAVLLNAIVFDAKWQEPYEENNVTEAVFCAADGSEQNCKMMHATESVFLLDTNAKGFLKYYQGGQYAFMAMLPDEGISLSDYVSGLTGEKLLSLYKGRNENSVVITSMPKFKFDWGGSIKDGVKALGLEKAFDPAADFTNMAETATGQLYIGDVIHKTHIDVDTEGTKAAAATEIDMKCGGAMVDFVSVVLDRPFVFAVIDTENGLPVFIGAVNSIDS